MIPATAFPSFRYRVPRDGRLFRAGLASSAIAKGAPRIPTAPAMRSRQPHARTLGCENKHLLSTCNETKEAEHVT
jgi:hypothetical protein